MKIYDISRTLQEAPLYPGSAEPELYPIESVGGASCSWIGADSHAGTHADAVSHFFPDGTTIDAMPLENYCGPCRVLTVPGGGLITLDDLRGRLNGAQRLALHTGGDAYLCEQAAEYIVACGVLALVTDAVSVGPTDNEAMIHGILMNGGVAIIENAVLDHIADGDYLLFAFPIKYGGCDGAPVRAVLLGSDKTAPAANPAPAVQTPAAPEPDLDAETDAELDVDLELDADLDLDLDLDLNADLGLDADLSPEAETAEEISPAAAVALDNPEEAVYNT